MSTEVSNDEELMIVEFPSILQVERKILGVFDTLELLILLLVVGGTATLLQSYLGYYAYIISLLIVISFVMLKLVMPDEVGFAFPLYAMKRGIMSYETENAVNVPTVKTVEDWYIKTPSGYSAVIEVNPVNFFYSTPSDQRAHMKAFADLLNTIEFPIQIICLSTEFEANRYLNRLLLRLKDEDIAFNDALRNFAESYLKWFSDTIKTVKARKYYIVVSVTHGEFKNAKEEQILTELRKRAEIVLTTLRNGGIAAKLLDRNEIFHLYDQVFYRRLDMPKNYDSTALLIGTGEGR